MYSFFINDEIKILYNECDKDYIMDIINFFVLNYKDVMSFFNINQLDKSVVVKLWNDSDKFKIELENILESKMPSWVTGNSINDKDSEHSRIDYLSLKEIQNIDYHKNETIGDLKRGILHEFVHICHSQSCNYNYPKEYFLTEGVATYLAHQYNNCSLDVSIKTILDDTCYVEYKNYRYLFNILLEIYSHDDILSILNNKQKLNYSRIENYINNLVK